MMARLRSFASNPSNIPLVALAGFIVLGIMITAVAAAWEAWQAHAKRVEQDKLFYDICLIQNGSVVACDAAMRMRERYRR